MQGAGSIWVQVGGASSSSQSVFNVYEALQRRDREPDTVVQPQLRTLELFFNIFFGDLNGEVSPTLCFSQRPDSHGESPL